MKILFLVPVLYFISGNGFCLEDAQAKLDLLKKLPIRLSCVPNVNAGLKYNKDTKKWEPKIFSNIPENRFIARLYSLKDKDMNMKNTCFSKAFWEQHFNIDDLKNNFINGSIICISYNYMKNDNSVNIEQEFVTQCNVIFDEFKQNYSFACSFDFFISNFNEYFTGPSLRTSVNSHIDATVTEGSCTIIP